MGKRCYKMSCLPLLHVVIIVSGRIQFRNSNRFFSFTKFSNHKWVFFLVFWFCFNDLAPSLRGQSLYTSYTVPAYTCIHQTHQLKASVSSLLVSALQGGENAQLPLYWSCWKRECDYDVYLSLPVYLCRRAGGLRSGKRMPSGICVARVPVSGMPPSESAFFIMLRPFKLQTYLHSIPLSC